MWIFKVTKSDSQLISSCKREVERSNKTREKSVKGSRPEMIGTVEGLRNSRKFTVKCPRCRPFQQSFEANRVLQGIFWIHQNNYFVEHVWLVIWKYQNAIMGSMKLQLREMLFFPLLIFALSKYIWKGFYSLLFGSSMNHQVILSIERIYSC